MKHLRSLATTFFVLAYILALLMTIEDSLVVKVAGLTLAVFLTYQIIDKYFYE